MANNKVIISEAMKSTFLTIALFIFFDIAIQSYSSYHSWMISIYITAFSLYYLIAKRYL